MGSLANAPPDYDPRMYGKALFDEVEAGGLNTVPPDSGFFHTDAPGPQVSYKRGAGEKVIRRKNAYIVLGRDRPDSNRSGYGSYAAGAAAIDLVVGRMSCARGGDGPKDGTSVDNSFGCDAARVYISQKTDVDNNFGIAEGAGGFSMARSAVAIKADGVRIVGREGVKIVTGKCRGCKGYGGSPFSVMGGEPNSWGGKIDQPAPPIELIAGNNTGSKIQWGGMFNPIEEFEYLQPIPLGMNTRDAFFELGKVIDEIWSALYNLTLVQEIYNSVLGIDPLRGWVPGGAAVCAIQDLVLVQNSMYHTKINKILWEINYLYAFGYKFINSRNVKTT